jgi:hypothetical protein
MSYYLFSNKTLIKLTNSPPILTRYTNNPNYCSHTPPPLDNSGPNNILENIYVIENTNVIKTHVIRLYINQSCSENNIIDYLFNLTTRAIYKTKYSPDLVREALNKEQEMRLSPQVQSVFNQISRGIYDKKYYDWIDYLEEMQTNVAKSFFSDEHEVADFLQAMRMFTEDDDNNNVFWKKYNRAHNGFNIIGEPCLDVDLKKYKGANCTLHELLEDNRKTVIIASSYS